MDFPFRNKSGRILWLASLGGQTETRIEFTTDGWEGDLKFWHANA